MWLPRFVDKARLHLRGELPADFHKAFGFRLATDGVFMTHFGLTLEALLEAVKNAGADDAPIATWFLAQPGVTAESIAAWNELAPRLGLPGTPMERAFRWALTHYYTGDDLDPRVTTVFTGLAWDEGYLDEMPAALLP